MSLAGRIRRRGGVFLTAAVAMLTSGFAIAGMEENSLVGSDPFFDTSNWDTSLKQQLSNLIQSMKEMEGNLKLPDRPLDSHRRLSEFGNRKEWLEDNRLLRGKRAPRVRGRKQDLVGKSGSKKSTSSDNERDSNPTETDDVIYYFKSKNIESGAIINGKSKKGNGPRGAGKSKGKAKGKAKGKKKAKGKTQQSFVPTISVSPSISVAPSISNVPSQEPIAAASSIPTVAVSAEPSPASTPSRPSPRTSRPTKAIPGSTQPSGAETSGPTPAMTVISSAPSPVNVTSIVPSPASQGPSAVSIQPSLTKNLTTSAPSLGPVPPGFVRCTNDANLTCPDPKLAQYCDKSNSQSSFQTCLKNCIIGYCCIHDSDTKRARNCRDHQNCPFYIPCYIVWWKIQDTIGPAPYLRLKQSNGGPFYGSANDDDFTNTYLKPDKKFFDQFFGHHFLNDDTLPLTDATFENQKYW